MKAIDKSPRLDNPISLKRDAPGSPVLELAHLHSRDGGFYKKLDQVEKDLEKYDALLIVGGSGPIVDLANNDRVHDLISALQERGQADWRRVLRRRLPGLRPRLEDRKSIIWGKHVTGHCKEYDYKDGTGFMGTDFNMGPPPYPLEYILRDATGPDGQYVGNFGKETSVIVDFPFVTGRSTPDSYLTGQKMVEALENGFALRLVEYRVGRIGPRE